MPTMTRSGLAAEILSHGHVGTVPFSWRFRMVQVQDAHANAPLILSQLLKPCSGMKLAVSMRSM
jgi:hypothetical protein